MDGFQTPISFRPTLRISLWHNQSVVFQKQNCADIQGGISQVFGSQVFRSLDLVTFKHEEMDVSVEMYLPKGAPTVVRVKVSIISGFKICTSDFI